jgi:hypothetical protein
MLTDFPKLQCPFIRKDFAVDKQAYKKYGNKLQLRKPSAYLVTKEVNPGYEWVFDDEDTFAVEKLNGTNVKIRTEGGRIVEAQNRKNPIDLLQVLKGKAFLVEGIHIAAGKGYIQEAGEQAGEILGPKLQGNPYGLRTHIWYPFDRAVAVLRYNSFEQHDRTFENWSSWFKDYLTSRFHTKLKDSTAEAPVFAEGVVFYNLKRKAQGLTYMAKLRRDMFPWFYQPLIPILDYDSGR